MARGSNGARRPKRRSNPEPDARLRAHLVQANCHRHRQHGLDVPTSKHAVSAPSATARPDSKSRNLGCCAPPIAALATSQIDRRHRPTASLPTRKPRLIGLRTTWHEVTRERRSRARSAAFHSVSRREVSRRSGELIRRRLRGDLPSGPMSASGRREDCERHDLAVTPLMIYP